MFCMFGNDVESMIGLAVFGVNIIVFIIGLGIFIGNFVVFIFKMFINMVLVRCMFDLIDIDVGIIIIGEDNLVLKGEVLLEFIIEVVNGEIDLKVM